MNNVYNPMPSMGAQNWYSSNPTVTQPQYDMFSNTNVYKVTSLEEAIVKSNVRPSENVYFHQTKNEFYNVRVDINGNKTWQTFVYNVPNSVENIQISKADFDALVERVLVLEGKKTVETEGTNNA